jgi:hypothetical protein
MRVCTVCNKFYNSTFRGWYEIYTPRACSSSCFYRLIKEGYTEFDIDLSDPRVKMYSLEKSDRSFRSTYEERFDTWLDDNQFLKKARFERYYFIFKGLGAYVPDFLVDKRVFVEVKGIWTGEAKRKFKRFVEEFPEYPILVADLEFLTLLKRTSK